MDDGFKIVSSQGESTYDDGKPTSLATLDESYQIGEHIAANFSDGFYDGETLEQIDDSTYRVSYMSPKAVSTTDYNVQEKMLVLAVKKRYTNTSYVLNLRPVISTATLPLTKRLHNFFFLC